MSITVRQASSSDLDWIVEELKEFSRFFNSRASLFGDENYVRSTLQGLIDNHIVFVSENDETKTGFIAGIKVPHLFNPAIVMLTALFWWVKPKYRGTRSGMLLLNTFTEWGKENAHWISLGIENHSPVKNSSLEKRGYKLHERSFLLEAF